MKCGPLICFGFFLQTKSFIDIIFHTPAKIRTINFKQDDGIFTY